MKYRLDALEVEERERFMKVNGMGFEEVSHEDKMRRSEQLIGLAGVNQVSILKTTYYRVPFQQALSLVSQRAVFLEAGFAFVPLQKLVSIIVTRVSLC
jgi:DNA primase large subunit